MAHLFIRQDSVTCLLAMMLSPLGHLVGIVIATCAQKQMVWANAWRIIAAM